MATLDDYMANSGAQQAPGQAPEQDPRVAALAERLGVDYQTVVDGIYEGRYGEEMKQLESQMERANAMRDTAGPEGRQTGRVYMAANPLEHAAAAYQRHRGGKEAERLTGEQKEMLDTRDRATTAVARIKMEQQREKQDFLERMFMQQQQQAPQGPVGQAPQGPAGQAPQLPSAPPQMQPPQGPAGMAPNMSPAAAYSMNQNRWRNPMGPDMTAPGGPRGMY